MLTKIKLYIEGFILILIISLIGYSIYSTNKIKTLNQENNIAVNNIKSYTNLLSKKDSSNIQLKLSINQLSYYNDSLLKKMNTYIKDSKIKEKELKELQYLHSQIQKKDTIRIGDTIFIKNKNIDTTIGDKWYNLNLKLKYPDTIIVSPKFESELYISTLDKREFKENRKKFFIARWFQRRITVRTINVTEKNPYINIKDKRFIEFIK